LLDAELAIAYGHAMATPDLRPSRTVVLEDNLDLNEHDRAQLEHALERSLEQARIGDTMSAEETFAWLRNRREAAKRPR
jgi:hypothetical protein